MMRKLRRRVKRVAEKRRRMPSRAAVTRRWILRPDLSKPFHVELFVSPTRMHMHRAIEMNEGTEERDVRCMGMVRHYMSRVTGRLAVRPGQVIARMYLNLADLRSQPSEIIAHECTHAGMAWARLRKARLSLMAGEEVLCYAVGVLVPQVNHIGYVMKAFG